MQTKLVALVFLLNIIILIPLTENQIEEFNSKLNQLRYSKAKGDIIIKYFAKEEGIKYIKAEYSVDYGVDFDITNEKGVHSILEFRFDDEAFSGCKKIDRVYKEIVAVEGAENILATIFWLKEHSAISEVNQKEYQYCTINKELGGSANSDIFDEDKDKDKKINTFDFYTLFNISFIFFIIFNFFNFFWYIHLDLYAIFIYVLY